jgi:hypothetical protein
MRSPFRKARWPWRIPLNDTVTAEDKPALLSDKSTLDTRGNLASRSASFAALGFLLIVIIAALTSNQNRKSLSRNNGAYHKVDANETKAFLDMVEKDDRVATIYSLFLNITLLAIDVKKNPNDTILEIYRVPDVPFCGKVGYVLLSHQLAALVVIPSASTQPTLTRMCLNRLLSAPQILRAEPDQRTPYDLPVVPCRCRDKCDDLDFPAVSYIFKGHKTPTELKTVRGGVASLCHRRSLPRTHQSMACR